MRMTADEARARFASTSVARLATVTPDGAPHVVPVVFALIGDSILFAVDGKPKRTTDLQRVRNIAANPRAAFLVDEYVDDWTQLWWARADGHAVVVQPGTEGWRSTVDALRSAHRQYQDAPPTGPAVVTTVDRWSGWRVS